MPPISSLTRQLSCTRQGGGKGKGFNRKGRTLECQFQPLPLLLAEMGRESIITLSHRGITTKPWIRIQHLLQPCGQIRAFLLSISFTHSHTMTLRHRPVPWALGQQFHSLRNYMGNISIPACRLVPESCSFSFDGTYLGSSGR